MDMKWLVRLIDKAPDLPGNEALKRWGVKRPIRRVFLFWEVSASAWLIDVGCLMTLLHFGVPVFMAAVIAPLPAFLWGFTLSSYKIYFRAGGFSRRRFGMYLLFNAGVMVFGASIIHYGADAGFAPLAMKVAVTPATFLLNYFFTRMLLKTSKTRGARVA
jgi:hypothetical protein